MKPVAVLFCLLAALSANAQRGPVAAQFLRYPFDKWAAETAKPQLHWNVRPGQAHLSPHQRLVSDVRITVDGDELKKRQGSQILTFVRIYDAAGHSYQTANQASIAHLKKGTSFAEMVYSFSVFFLPGDYILEFAVCDAKTLEHSFTRQSFHVAPIKSDPLPLAWRDLPPVEFIPEDGIPYSWYLPQLRSVVRLPLDNERSVRIELMVNVTPSDLASLNMFRANMQLIVPAMKVLMGIDPAAGSVGLSIADLNRRTLLYEQPDLHVANVGRGSARGEWPRLRPALTGFSAAKVDAETLLNQSRMLDYFTREVTRRLASGGEPRVLIVLSAPVYFSKQEKPALPELPPDPTRRVFYIRYAQFLPRTREGQSYSFADDLERILKPRGARVFRAEHPEEFRKALGAILTEIASM